MTLTTATALFGVYYLFNAALNAVIGNWLNFGIDLAICIPFLLAVYKPHNVAVRKCIFWLMTTLNILFLLLLIIVIVTMSVVDWQE